MFGYAKTKQAVRGNHSDCSGCSLCLLVCPVWRNSRDVSLTPHGHAKAMQNDGLVASAQECSLCLACLPVCPENLDIVGMILALRKKNPLRTALPELQAIPPRIGPGLVAAPTGRALLLPDACLGDHPEMLDRIAALLGVDVSSSEGAELTLALEAAAEIPQQRLEHFLEPLRQLEKIIVADGLLLYFLKQWLPGANIIGLGWALSSHAKVRCNLLATDLYVIEPRAYHSDYQRLVKYYDHLRTLYGCAMNLDLQRIAIPATRRNLSQRMGMQATDDQGQTRWLLQGRNISRIVVESLEDRAAFAQVCDVEVVYLAELAWA